MDQEKKQGRFELSRRDFLKVSAAGAAAVTALDWAPAPAMAEMPYKTVGGVTDTAIDRYHSTCPYCSAQCGQIIAVGRQTHEIYDVYGDVDSPINNGGLCAKGAGSLQLVNNTRRLGVPEHTASVDGTDFSGRAWRRVGDNAWDEISLETAYDEIAGGWTGTDSGGHAGAHAGMVALRGSVAAPNPNSKNVMFFGCSHANNEPNYLYRKLIANFGTTNVEHQARI